MNTKRIPEDILTDIRRNTPFGKDGDFTDAEINSKSKRELLNHWLNWNGIVNYTGDIIKVIEAIYGVKLPQ